MIDYAALLSQLEDQEQHQRAELGKTASAIAAIRPLVNGKQPAPARTRRAPTGKAAGPKGGRASKVSEVQWAEAREAWDAGEKSATIGKRIGLSGAGVLYHAKTYKWPKRPRGGKKPGAAKGVAGESLGGRVTCQSCQLKTDRDPCTNCGKPVRK